MTVVDAKYISDQLGQSAESCEQIAFADLILLNKTDLSTPEQLDEDRGRAGDCSPPPAQIRTGPIKASGSYLEYLTANRALGQG